MRGVTMTFELSNQIQPIHDWHLQIGENQVGSGSHYSEQRGQ
jgi:hypothetical protein